MTDPLKTLDAILQGASVGPQQFAPNSRYYGLPTATLTTADGRLLSYLTRRFVPAPESFSMQQVYTVVQNDRLDSIAAKYFGDPVLYWRICDANRALRPAELTETIGTQLSITLPLGIQQPAGSR
jgi:nucleoid-associated protein YgaU